MRARVRDRQELGRATPLSIDWQRVYDEEPDVYDRLISGEHIHPGVLGWLPRCERAADIGAGTGRLTVELARRCDRVVAVEPSAGMRQILVRRVQRGVGVVAGRFRALPLPDGWADLVCSCSALKPEHGDEALREMERVSSGTVVVVWPTTPDWLVSHGYEYLSFPGDMAHRFASLDDAISLARRFYPDAVDEIRRRGSPDVPYEVLGINAPRDLCFKNVR